MNRTAGVRRSVGWREVESRLWYDMPSEGGRAARGVLGDGEPATGHRSSDSESLICALCNVARRNLQVCMGNVA